jgi:hypothetical protein
VVRIGIPAEKYFYAADGSILKNKKELLRALKNMSDAAFSYHANASKNDFASWIRDVFSEKALSERMQRAATRAELISVLANTHKNKPQKPKHIKREKTKKIAKESKMVKKAVKTKKAKPAPAKKLAKKQFANKRQHKAPMKKASLVRKSPALPPVPVQPPQPVAQPAMHEYFKPVEEVEKPDLQISPKKEHHGYSRFLIFICILTGIALITSILTGEPKIALYIIIAIVIFLVILIVVSIFTAKKPEHNEEIEHAISEYQNK